MLLLVGTGVFSQGTHTIHLKNGSTVTGRLITQNKDGSVVLKVDGVNKEYWKSEIESFDIPAETVLSNAVKGAKTRYKDGRALLYFVRDGISITMAFGTQKEYGNYYIASIAIENFTGTSFDFDPSQIKAILTNKGLSEDLFIYSSDEYQKRLKHKQGVSSFFYAWGQNYAAGQAGYSTSYTTSQSNFATAGYYGSNYGYARGSSITQSYNSTDAYAAQQNANSNVANLKAQQFQIRNQSDMGYLKRNTLDNEDRVTGQVNMEFRKGDKNMAMAKPATGENK